MSARALRSMVPQTCVRPCVRAFLRAFLRACVRARVRACVRACVRARPHTHSPGRELVRIGDTILAIADKVLRVSEATIDTIGAAAILT
eukprot:6061745-Pleurochrysis_carterae.AAC.1